MREIERTSQFKRDYKRENRGRHSADLQELLQSVLERLANDEALAASFQDHSLSGDWKDHRECHLKPDLLLIYKKPDTEILRLVRLGSHSELFS